MGINALVIWDTIGLDNSAPAHCMNQYRFITYSAKFEYRYQWVNFHLGDLIMLSTNCMYIWKYMCMKMYVFDSVYFKMLAYCLKATSSDTGLLPMATLPHLTTLPRCGWVNSLPCKHLCIGDLIIFSLDNGLSIRSNTVFWTNADAVRKLLTTLSQYQSVTH